MFRITNQLVLFHFTSTKKNKEKKKLEKRKKEEEKKKKKKKKGDTTQHYRVTYLSTRNQAVYRLTSTNKVTRACGCVCGGGGGGGACVLAACVCVRARVCAALHGVFRPGLTLRLKAILYAITR